MVPSRITLPKRVTARHPRRTHRIPASLPILALLCAAAFLAGATTATAATVNVHPGKWEMSTTVDVQGRLPGKDKAPVTTRCIKPEDVKDADAMVQASQKDKRCKTTVVSATSDHVAWSYDCPTGLGSADYAYAGDSYESTFVFIVHAADGDHKTTQHTKAHRIGDCP
ncbi:MAG TPA: DUF3617 family protein [Thermoanaerobaculia bacterium]|nr:DUF3617 family protein [Thermoanaerobaculia bacterium]